MPATMEKTEVIETEVVENAVRLACRAPSLYNSQPWQWEYHNGRLQLFVDRRRVMDNDRFGREALIGCGAVLDHLRVATAAAGWAADIERFPDPENPDHLASIGFARRDQVTDAQRRRANAILLRRSDRLPFLPPRNWELFEPTLRSAVEDGAVRLDLLSDELRPQLAEATRVAQSLRLYDTGYHTELDWWSTSFRAWDGIPQSSLVSAAERDRVDVARRFPFAHHSERRTEIPEDHAKILVLSTDNDNRTDALACGEALSAVLLECTMAGLATCALTHLTELHTTRDMVAVLLDHDAMPQVLVRVGVVPAMEQAPPATPRRPLEDILRLRN
jgi:nitroreductase